MELRNSVWNELCATVGRTTTKMNVPRFFIYLQAVNTQNTNLCKIFWVREIATVYSEDICLQTLFLLFKC